MASVLPEKKSPPTGTVVSPDDPTLGKLVADASRDFSALVRQEIQLAKSELKVSARTGGIGLGLFAAAAFLAVCMVILLSVTVAYFIHWNGSGLDLHWAFLIVTLFYALLAGVLAFLGLRKVKKVRGPERAIAQAQETKVALTKRS